MGGLIKRGTSAAIKDNQNNVSYRVRRYIYHVLTVHVPPYKHDY